MTKEGDSWAAWLRDQFDRHPTIRKPADLARAGGLKRNGRPFVDPSSITQWLRGRRPSFDLARRTAEAFGRPAEEGLSAAGYDVTPPGPPGSVPGPSEDRGYVSRTAGEDVDLTDVTLDRLLEELARRARQGDQ